MFGKFVWYSFFHATTIEKNVNRQKVRLKRRGIARFVNMTDFWYFYRRCYGYDGVLEECGIGNGNRGEGQIS